MFNNHTLLKTDCGVPALQQQILGGREAEPGDLPFMALLGYKQPNYRILYICGGTVINRYYVLTAAHCITGQQPV